MDITNIYAVVGPAVFVLIGIEILYCLWKKPDYYSFQDSMIGMGTMIIAQCVNVAVAVGVVVTYNWIFQNLAITTLAPTLTNYALCYLGVDFLFYWFHRAGHRINIFWAIHVPHHTAEELNYAVGLRASFTQRAASFLFYWPLAVVGFGPEIILPTVATNLVIQLLGHTRVVPKLPAWIDSWLNTPYHHQVHHAANQIYWDKNYGGTFIFWDKWFGSFRHQTEEPFYGVSVHPRSWDPTYLNIHWFIVLWKDMMAATHFVDKILIWFKPPGWRPRNIKVPYEKTPSLREGPQNKYKTTPFAGTNAYLCFQLVACMSAMYLVISTSSPLSSLEKINMTLLLWMAVTVWGGLLEKKRWTLAVELGRLSIFGMYMTRLVHSYFTSTAWALPLVLSYSAISAAWVVWVCRELFQSSSGQQRQSA